MPRFAILLIFSLIPCSIFASGIAFYESISIDRAIEIAKREGKNIFIDTYTDWCIPCKKMEKNFHDAEVAAFYNAHFVNVRINMDFSEYAGEYRKQFDVIFLPTLLILDTDGKTRFKADRILSKIDLISLGKKSLNPNTYLPSMATEIVASPMTSAPSVSQEVKGPETIIHVMGKDMKNLPPEILREEAYFRLQLMDGSHIEASRAYLKTQNDWLSTKNMRFILDFAPDARSKEFDFIVANRDTFYTIVGSDQVERTIQILIYMQLHQGYPRPNFEETQTLYQMVNKKNYKLLSYQYFMSRLLDECNMEEYIKLAQNYLLEINPSDDYVMYVMADYLSEFEDSKTKTLQWVLKAIKSNPNEPDYYFLGADMYLQQGDIKKATSYIDQAIDLAIKDGRKMEHYEKLKNIILYRSKKT